MAGVPIAFELGAPVAVESRPSHLHALRDSVSRRVHNDYAFPSACTVRFTFAPRGDRAAPALFWYDCGMKPPTPEELGEADLPAEGMMFVGDSGKIFGDFREEWPRIIPEQKMREFRAARVLADGGAASSLTRDRLARLAAWVSAVRGGEPTYGDFLLAGPSFDVFNLAAVFLRMGGRRLGFDVQG